MPVNRALKLDKDVPAGMFDFLTDVEPDIDCENDSLSRFMENAKAAGAYGKMSSDVAHQHVHNLREESRERDLKFAKRFETSTPADSKTLAKSSSPAPDAWEQLVMRASKMRRDGNIVKLFDSEGELLAEREVTA